jgi:hypothetical protein
MKDELLLKLHKDIIERLKEIGREDYDYDLSDLNDPVINTILEMRKLLMTGSYINY